MNIHTYAELLRIVICTTICISYNSVKLTSHPQLCYNKKAETAFRHVSARFRNLNLTEGLCFEQLY